MPEARIPGTAGRGLGVALAFPGDGGSDETWSGVPSGLARGFRELGVEVEHLSTEIPLPLKLPITASLALLRMHRVDPGPPLDRIRRSRIAVMEGSAEVAVARSLMARRRLRTRRHDALVQIGTGYTLPPTAPIATFEDTTIQQAMALGIPWWRAQSPAAVRSRVERQRRAYAQAHVCCAASAWAARSIVQDYGIPDGKVRVVGFGRNHDPRPLARDWSVPRFLFIGREWERKGGPALVRAFAQLRRRMPTAELDVVGMHPRISVAGVRGHGWVTRDDASSRRRIIDLFERATCYVMPSRFEPFGIAHAEAAAAGVPSIGTTIGGAAELIGPDGGRLVAPGDEEALLAAMLELADPQTAAGMGAAARERSDQFTWGAVAERMLDALEITDHNRRPPDVSLRAGVRA